ncbi:PGPGW domain-containing protein [Auraticoccus monumenti]|uniref:TIGR02611 family protein n=1 Tax=Auraticoccus monumenti TaxID=675864 RepID=A0A1G7BMR3_9ACTN|nr:PGPGW domain-containing protein [Auraticoccus monumenti]SDE28359.1 TIGR02611 family protein [Auraticoccus monumenti]
MQPGVEHPRRAGVDQQTSPGRTGSPSSPEPPPAPQPPPRDVARAITGPGEADAARAFVLDPEVEDALDEQRHDRWAWRRRLRERRHTRITLRVVVGLLGTLLILAGVVTGPLPGPGGIPLVLLGLAVWASEFRWARRLMRRFREVVRWVGGWPRRRKVVVGAVALVVGWTALYGGLWLNGIPTWLPDVVAGPLDRVPGLSPAGHER